MNQAVEFVNLNTSFNNKAALTQLINDMKAKKPQSAIKIESERRPLSKDFVPGPYDVICARGKKAAEHPGNVRFREIIQKFKPEYAQATNKVEKSLLVTEIVDSVREFTPEGGFVKKFGDRWCEVGDSVAREKIGQCLRDQLHSQYKSSTKAKKNRRKELRQMKKEAELEEEEPKQVETFGLHNLPFPNILPLPLESQTSLSLIPLESQSSMALLKEFAAATPI